MITRMPEQAWAGINRRAGTILVVDWGGGHYNMTTRAEGEGGKVERTQSP